MKTGFICATKRQLNYGSNVAVREHFSSSSYFRYSLAYCEKNYDQIFVLCIGANYLLHPDSAVDDVDTKIQIHDLDRPRKKKWLREISQEIKQVCPQESELYFHTNRWYGLLFEWLHKPDLLTSEPTHFVIYEPLKSMAIGKQLHFYKQQIGQLASIKNKEAK
ncbi:MAG: DUF6884 domain-containing protein [Patescibacteria group bacterium]